MGEGEDLYGGGTKLSNQINEKYKHTHIRPYYHSRLPADHNYNRYFIDSEKKD